MRSIDQTVRLSPRQGSGPMQSFRRGRIRYDVKAGSTRKLPRSVDSETGRFWQDLVLEGSPMKKSRLTESQIVAVLKSAWRVVQGAGYRAAFHPAWQARPECLHRVLQPDLSRRGSERMPVRLVGGGAGDHRRTARAQRNQATRCAGKPAASALPRAFARRGNSSVELSTRRRSLRTIR
jgi:hypothetical protein